MSYAEEHELKKHIARRALLIASEHGIKVNSVNVAFVDEVFSGGALAIKVEDGVLLLMIKRVFREEAHTINELLHVALSKLARQK